VFLKVHGVALQRHEHSEDTLMCNTSPNSDSSNDGAKRPPMVNAELLGRHVHRSTSGVAVHIWRRGSSYIARGSYLGQRYGETLGADERQAEARLHEVLYEIGQGTFVLPKERSKRQLARLSVVRSTIRQLIDEFLIEKRNTRGEQLAKDYRCRLVPLIEFSEFDKTRNRWPAAADIGRQFAIEYKTTLASRVVNRNGRAASQDKLISPHQIYNALDCARTMFNWARSVQVAKLPSNFVNPFTKDIVGQRPQKDPLRQSLYPMDRRVQLVANMDEWQLTHLAVPLLLPLRPEDFTGLLIGDVDYENGLLKFGSRFGGRDFNKGHVSFGCPYPTELASLVRFLAGERAEGPLLRARTVFEGRREPSRVADAEHTAEWHIEDAFRHAVPRHLVTPHDQKTLVRRTIREMGGVAGDDLADEFVRVLERAGLQKRGRFYDLRGSISTELDRAGVSVLVQRYVTGHTTSDILNQYVSLDPSLEMQKYFATLGPLLDAMHHRAQQLGLKLPI
jgi:hypothetical protein